MASKRSVIREYLRLPDGSWPLDAKGVARLPVPYDLAILLLEDGRQISGWNMKDGALWGGRKLKETDRVIGWRYRTEFNYD